MVHFVQPHKKDSLKPNALQEVQLRSLEKEKVLVPNLIFVHIVATGIMGIQDQSTAVDQVNEPADTINNTLTKKSDILKLQTSY